MKKFGSLLTLLLFVNVLAALGLVGYLVATGRLDKSKAVVMLDMVRHQGTPDGLREKLYDIMEPMPATTSAPAPTVAKEVENGLASVLAASASDRLEMSRHAIEQERLELENIAQDLRNRQKTLEDRQREIGVQQKKLEESRAAYQKQQDADAAKLKDDSFQKSLALYDELKPKQIKDLFLTMPEVTAANFLQAMDPSRAAKIIAEFKSPTERTYISTVLDRIRGAAAGSGTGAASGTSVTSTGQGPAAGI